MSEEFNKDEFKKASDDTLMDQLIYGESMIKIDNKDGIRRIEPGSDEHFRLYKKINDGND